MFVSFRGAPKYVIVGDLGMGAMVVEMELDPVVGFIR